MLKQNAIHVIHQCTEHFKAQNAFAKMVIMMMAQLKNAKSAIILGK